MSLDGAIAGYHKRKTRDESVTVIFKGRGVMMTQFASDTHCYCYITQGILFRLLVSACFFVTVLGHASWALR